MNEKSCLNETVFVFAIQSFFWKFLIWPTRKSNMLAKCLGLDRSNLGLIVMPDLTNNKQKGQSYTLVVKRERRRRRRRNTNNRSMTAIQSLFVYTHHNMWKRVRLRIQWDDRWSYLSIKKRNKRLLYSAGATLPFAGEEK